MARILEPREIKVFRWIKKYFPNRHAIISSSFKKTQDLLAKYDFYVTDSPVDGVITQVNCLNFERKRKDEFDFIEIIFDKNEPFRFQVSFGTKKLDLTHTWITSGCLSKENSDSMSARWWGARRIGILKEASFHRDWDKLDDSLIKVVEFLSTGNVAGFIVRRVIGG